MFNTVVIFTFSMTLFSCSTNTDSKASDSDTLPTGTPLFIVAGQSNAEGNVRLSGLEAFRDALPGHDNDLSESERQSLLTAVQNGVGDWCSPDEDFSIDEANFAIDEFRDGGLDLSGMSPSYVIDGTQMVAYRWFYQDFNEPLGEPYQNESPDAPDSQTLRVSPLGPGFGFVDSEETTVLFYGPELGFGMQIDQSQSLPQFELLKIAMGGSSLYGHWAPEGPLTTELYARIERHLSDDSDRYVAGLLWFQGFNDQFEEASVLAYEDNLKQFIGTFRSVYGGTVPVVVVQSQRSGPLSDIADAQERVANALNEVGLIESDGLSPCFHYDSLSQMIIGQRSAVEMLRLME